MNSERGEIFDIVRRKAVQIIQSPMDYGYSYLDLSASLGLPAHSLHEDDPHPHSLQILHSVAALPPRPVHLQYAQKDIPFPIDLHHMVATPALGTPQEEAFLNMYHEILVNLSSSVMERVGKMQKWEHDTYMERLAAMPSEDPFVLYALLASDYTEPGVLSPDSVRIYTLDGYSMALATRDLVHSAHIGVILN